MQLATEVRNIVKALKSGHTNEEIAQILDCDVDSVVSCILENGGKLRLPSQTAKQTTKQPAQGRPKVFDNRKIVEELLAQHPHYTSIDVQQQLQEQYGIAVSRRTLQRRISEIRPKLATPTGGGGGGLSAIDKQRRLDWACAHRDWTVRDWRNIFNMDDIKCIEDDALPKQIFEDTLMGPEGTHSSDLNLLEQLMAIIAPKIKAQAPQNVNHFRQVLYVVWHSDQELVDQIEQLYESMPLRVAAVLQSSGDETEFC